MSFGRKRAAPSPERRLATRTSLRSAIFIGHVQAICLPGQDEARADAMMADAFVGVFLAWAEDFMPDLPHSHGPSILAPRIAGHVGALLDSATHFDRSDPPLHHAHISDILQKQRCAAAAMALVARAMGAALQGDALDLGVVQTLIGAGPNFLAERNARLALHTAQDAEDARDIREGRALALEPLWRTQEGMAAARAAEAGVLQIISNYSAWAAPVARWLSLRSAGGRALLCSEEDVRRRLEALFSQDRRFWEGPPLAIVETLSATIENAS